MSEELLNAEQVRELLSSADARDYTVNELTPSVVLTPHGRIAVSWTSNRDPAVTERAEATAALIAAAPTLAHTALSALARAEAAEAELERLREVLERVERRADKGADRNAYGALRAIRLEVRAALARPAAAEAGAGGGEGKADGQG